MRISSVFTSPDLSDPDLRNASVRLVDLDEDSVDSLIATLKIRDTLLFFVEDGRPPLID